MSPLPASSPDSFSDPATVDALADKLRFLRRKNPMMRFLRFVAERERKDPNDMQVLASFALDLIKRYDAYAQNNDPSADPTQLSYCNTNEVEALLSISDPFPEVNYERRRFLLGMGSIALFGMGANHTKNAYSEHIRSGRLEKKLKGPPPPPAQDISLLQSELKAAKKTVVNDGAKAVLEFLGAAACVVGSHVDKNQSYARAGEAIGDVWIELEKQLMPPETERKGR